MESSEREAIERVERAMALISGKWKSAIMYALVFKGKLRFMEIRRMIPRVSQRMLTQQLRELERHGLVQRTHFPEIPPRVEYAITPLGRTVHPIFKAVCDWATDNLEAVEKALPPLRWGRKISTGKPDSAP
jgi:DNA-binding HxlR family transcriptional regulator